MKTTSIISILAVLLIGCTSKNDAPQPTHNDSIITAPIAPAKDTTVQAPADPATGLLIDHARMRTPQHDKLLERFKPSEVVQIYHDFKPLRKPGITKEQVDTYLKQKNITLDELTAVLEEGDLLGWNKTK